MNDNFLSTFPELQNLSFQVLPLSDTTLCEKTIYKISFKRRGYNTRKGLEVDRPKIESILSRFDNHESMLFITTLDYHSKNTINVPLGFINCKAIKKSSDYYKQHNKSIKTYGNLFWRGNTETHQIRKKIIDGLNLKSNKNFELAHWTPSAGLFYSDNACTETEYDVYFNQLKQSDTFLIMRGDKPWTNSFFDCLRANTIAVCIDTFYHKLGWHKIGYKIEDLLMGTSRSI